MENSVSEKMHFYESFAESFDSRMNMYDTKKRLDVVFNELLTEVVRNMKVLDTGSMPFLGPVILNIAVKAKKPE